MGAVQQTAAEKQQRQPNDVVEMRVQMAEEEAARGSVGGVTGMPKPITVSQDEYNTLISSGRLGTPSYTAAKLEQLGINPPVGAGGGIQAFAYQDSANDLGTPVAIPIASAEPPDYQQALNRLGQLRASDQAYYTGAIGNARSGFGAALNSIGRSLNNAAYDIAQGGVGLYGLATDSDLRSRTLDAIGSVVNDFAANPLGSTAAGFNSAIDYFNTTSTQQIGEDALRLLAGGLATDGLGRIALSGVRAAGGLFVDELPSAGTLPSLAALDALAAFRSANPISARVLDTYQGFIDLGFARVETRSAAGVFDNVSPGLLQAVKGQEVDSFARVALRDALRPGGSLEDLAGSISVNRRLYDIAGSGSYRVPDVYIPGENAILDGTIGTKSLATPQVADFFGFSNTRNVVIVAPRIAPQLIMRPLNLAGL